MESELSVLVVILLVHGLTLVSTQECSGQQPVSIVHNHYGQPQDEGVQRNDKEVIGVGPQGKPGKRGAQGDKGEKGNQVS